MKYQHELNQDEYSMNIPHSLPSRHLLFVMGFVIFYIFGNSAEPAVWSHPATDCLQLEVDIVGEVLDRVPNLSETDCQLEVRET